MSDNINKQYAARTAHTYDLESGEQLLVTYFPVAGVVTINGHSVSRAQKDEDMDRQARFLWRTDKKLFTVDALSLTKLFI